MKAFRLNPPTRIDVRLPNGEPAKDGDGNPVTTTFDELKVLISLVENPPAPAAGEKSNGLDFKDVQKSIRVLDALEKQLRDPDGETTYRLEDADYDLLLGRLKNVRFSGVDRKVFDLFQRIFDAETVEVAS